MAQLNCSMCETEPAAFLLNNLIDGGTEQVCINCWPLFIISIAEQMTGLVEGATPEAPEEPETATAVETPAETVSTPETPAETPSPDPKRNGRSRAKSSVAPTATETEESGETIADPQPANAE